MVDSLFSESWYRVAQLKPRLRSHVQIHHHVYRGRDWFVLQDHSSGRLQRFSLEAYHVIGLMDGNRTLDRIWEASCAALGDDMPTQDEVIRLIAHLHKADLLQCDIPPDISDLHQRAIREKRGKLLGQIGSPFAIRLPLWDPERFLAATEFVVRPLIGWLGLLLWLAVVVTAIGLAGLHWEALTLNLADRVLALENLVVLWLVYPLVKLLHEFAHAYAVKHWGGEVHDIGVMLLVFMPLPYVDASAASAFNQRYKRVMVGAAGIMAELFLAGLAMFVWVAVEPGPLRSAAFNIMVIGGVSTIVFNGNPLLRFDAYYVLSDLLEIPNLAARSTAYLRYLLQRYLLGIEQVTSPVSSPGEAPWLGFYAVAAFGYRIFITVRIAAFVAGKFFAVGVLLAAWGLFGMVVWPAFKAMRTLISDPAMHKRRHRALGIAIVGIGLAALVVLAIPLPSFTVAEGVVEAPKNARVNAGADGVISSVVARSGDSVRRGDPLLICENSDLASEVKVLEAEQEELEARHRLSVTRDRTEAEILKDEIARLDVELRQKKDMWEALVIRSPADGVFILPEPAEDQPGRFVRRGASIGFVLDFAQATVHAVVPQSRVDLVRTNTRSVTIRLARDLKRPFPARVGRELPGASTDLPSLALSLEGGGALALDPRETDAPKAFQTLFHFEVLVSGDVAFNTIGDRVYVRFEHAPEPVGFRWFRSLRRNLLSHFNV